MISFVNISLETHLVNVGNQAAAKVNGMSNADLLRDTTVSRAVAERKVLLITRGKADYTSEPPCLARWLSSSFLYHNDLVPSTIPQFQPYNTVIEFNALNQPTKVLYSWTLGRAVACATGSEIEEVRRSLTFDLWFAICRCNADSDLCPVFAFCGAVK